jgi:ATP-dependent protease ClpP protease subunit
VTKVYPLKCQIQAQDGGPTRIEVYDDIGEGGWFSEGLTAKAFAASLAAVKGPLDVHINSYGGDVGDGLAIAATIRGHKGTKRTVVDGFAASIASVIVQAGDERVMQPGSMLMVHDALSACVGNAADMKETAEFLDKHSDNLASIYADRAGGTSQQWRDTMQKDTWYTAEEAVAAGLADRIGDEAATLPASFDLAAFEMVPGRIAARLHALPVLNADGNHAPMTGTHSHSHPAYGSQGGDTTHSHEHSHDGDASHQHSHDGAAARGDGWVFRDAAHGHDGACWDPDNDGDCDLTPAGDTDHDYWSASGEQLQSVPGQPMGDALGERIRAILREELVAAGLLNADKYKQADRDRMAKSGEAMPDGSYPIADEEDLDNAIRAVGRGGADHDTIRAHIIKRAAALGLSSKVPDNWNSDGSLKTASDHAHIDLSGIDLEEIAAGLKGAFA